MFKKFFDLSLDSLCIKNSENFLNVNPAFIKLLGHSKAELTSKPFIYFVHAQDVEKTQQMINDLENRKTVSNFENRYKHKEGHYINLSWSIVRDSEDQLIYAVARDITSLRHNERLLTQISDSLFEHTIIAITDPKGVIIEANKRFCEVSGFLKSELIGKTHQIVNSGKHTKDFWKSMWKDISTGKTWSGIIENKAKNGESYFVYSVFTPLLDNQGQIQNYLAIRFEMTNEIKLKQDLKHTLSILNDTNSIAKIGGWELIISTGELNWTDETFKILEIEKRDGQKPSLPEGLELFIPEHKLIIERAVQRGIELGEPYGLEVQALTAKKNTLWVYTNGRAHYEDGKVVKLSGTIQDINNKKMTELKLELERQKSSQYAKLATLGELSAGIAHEINNPLTIIMGNLPYLKNFINSPDQFDEKISSLIRSCDRIHAITKNLVKHARKSHDSELRAIHISSIAKESVDMAKLKAKQYNTDIIINSNSEHMIYCNEVEVEQVFINLINNAIDATKDLPNPWVQVDINDIDDKIQIQVIDSGPGIPKEAADQIFEPFFTTKKEGEGTGLGLSILKGILENHNASISINHAHQNTCFVITFPRYI